MLCGTFLLSILPEEKECKKSRKTTLAFLSDWMLPRMKEILQIFFLTLRKKQATHCICLSKWKHSLFSISVHPMNISVKCSSTFFGFYSLGLSPICPLFLGAVGRVSPSVLEYFGFRVCAILCHPW